MNNSAKIYTLVFAIEDIILSIGSHLTRQDNPQKRFDSDALFNKFLARGKDHYSELHYDLICEIGASQTKAEDEFGKLASVVERFLGQIEKDNVYLVYYLWLAYNCALAEYYFVSPAENKPNLDLERRQRLERAYLQYESESSGSEETWNLAQSRVEAKLGFRGS